MLALVLLLGACGNDATTAAPTPAANATTTPLLPTTTAALPPTDPARFDELLSQLRGTPVLVNVWASWCEPCKTETPRLVDAHARFGDRVQFLGVDILDSRNSAESFLSAYGVPYPSVFDPPGAIRDSLGIIGQPGTVFIDASGSVVRSVSGEISSTDLDANLRNIAA